MTATVHHAAGLPWGFAPEDERRFRNLSVAALVVFVALAAIIPNLKVAEPPRHEAEAVSPRLAKLVLERQQLPPPPPPPPPPKMEEKKPELPKPEKKPEVAKPEVKQEIPPPPTNTPVPQRDVAVARERASKSGLLALSDQLADLRDNTAVSNVTSNTRLSTGGAAATQRSIITSNATKGSGGISTAGLSRDTGNTTLATRSTTAVTSNLPEAGPVRKNARSQEAIKLVLDQNMGAVYSLYHRALRDNPSLEGKVVLDITIDASGQVRDCKVVSSAIDDQDMLQKLKARVKLFNFGAKPVETVVYTWTIDFVPSS